MKLTKPFGIILITLSLIVSLSASAYATAKSSSRIQGLKIAVIQNALGSSKLTQGEYQSAANSLLTGVNSLPSYEKSFGLCVASLKLDHINQARAHCSKAIDLLGEITINKKKVSYLTAIAYSNRAIVNHFDGNHTAALSDLSSALLIDNNDIVKHNLLYLKEKYSNIKDAGFSTTMAAVIAD